MEILLFIYAGFWGAGVLGWSGKLGIATPSILLLFPLISLNLLYLYNQNAKYYKEAVERQNKEAALSMQLNQLSKVCLIYIHVLDLVPLLFISETLGWS